MSTETVTIFVELKSIEPQPQNSWGSNKVVLGRLLKSRPNDPRGTVIKVNLHVDPEDLMPEAEAHIGGLKPDIIIQAIRDAEDA